MSDVSEIRGSCEFARLGEILGWIEVTKFSFYIQFISCILNDAAGAVVTTALSGIDVDVVSQP